MNPSSGSPWRFAPWLCAFAVSSVGLLGAAVYWARERPPAEPRRDRAQKDNEREKRQRSPTGQPPPSVAPSQRSDGPPSHVTVPTFVDVAQPMGIQFQYVRGETGHFWPVEPVGGGAGWIDFDSDGWMDLVLVNGAQLPVDPTLRFTATRLYRNIQGERFEDVTESAGLLSHDYGQGCAVADYDNDGDADLYVTNFGRCALYRNNHDGTFTEVTDDAGVPAGEWNTGACFADLNRDGILDLFVAGYFHFTQEGYQSCRSPKGTPQYCGPSDAPPLSDFLYQGRGDGTFEDVSAAFGDPPPEAAGFGAVAADLDNDGWPDLYVANDAGANFLFQNRTHENPTGRILLKEVAYEWGAAVNADGLPQASMGLACADFDRNGFLDLAVSNFLFEYTTVYVNNRDQYFVDSSQRLKLLAATHSTMGWGLAFLDYDNNGWLDLFIANGHINRIEYSSQPYEMKAQLFHNDRGTRFVEVGHWSGPYFAQPVLGRGAAVGDFDNDGRADLAIVHHHRPASLLRNETVADTSSVTLELVGVASNRDALNTRLHVWLAPEELDKESGSLGSGPKLDGDKPLVVSEVVSGDSYLSSNDRRLLIGLGRGKSIQRGEIRWPSGQIQTFGELPAGTRWRVFEGTEPNVRLRPIAREW